MLPLIEPVNPDTMQTGELERAAAEEAPPHASMTVTSESPQPHNLLPPPLVATTAADYKLKNDNDATDTTASSDVEAESDSEQFPQFSPLSNSFQMHQSQSGIDIPGGVPDQNSNESVRSWLQRIQAMQQEIQRKQKLHQTMQMNTTVPPNSNMLYAQHQQQPQQPVPPSRVVKYQDLPYMGEMTLDNSKPRRGRKPKKADICHLIYKNYGTIFPGTPKNIMDARNEIKKVSTAKSKEQTILEPVQRTNVQNRIISSLLEKRLTQESLRNKELLANAQLLKASENAEANPKMSPDEPLNLCIRDLNQLKIRLLRKHGNVYASDSISTELKSEPTSEDDDVEFIDETPSPDVITQLPRLTPTENDPEGIPTFPDALRNGCSDLTAPGGYVYWPNAGVFIHPMALQSQLMHYQRLAAGGSYTLPVGEANLPPPSPVDSTTSNSSREFRKLVPKHLAVPRGGNNHHQEGNHQSSPPISLDDASEISITPAVTPTPIPEPRTKRGAAQSGNAPTKRKRSAIFIPPIPSENQTNPATEVSICKFKFTGGAKPSLQEKKMLSVDSGGNFRYYSGTGDKSMRGYEFFPRETLQQQAAAGSSHGSGTGAFLQASGEKLPMLPPSDPKSIPPEFMFAPDTPLHNLPPLSPDLVGGINSSRHRKRKTRKSLQREKLEQTFKEKGFLIQTQQLESAEGATYCKFRQLRKFTRYLFRSWKDYLPGSVRELQENERTDEDDVLLDGASAASVIVENDQSNLDGGTLRPNDMTTSA